MAGHKLALTLMLSLVGLFSIKCAFCEAALDPRYALVTGQQLNDSLARSGSSPADRIVQINQALNSGRIDKAYEFFNRRVQSGNPSAMDYLLLGMTAGAYSSCLNPVAPNAAATSAFRARLFRQSDQCLATAYRLDPDDGVIDAVYGACLVESPSSTSVERGLKLLRRGVKLSPGVAACHLCLAEGLMGQVVARNSQTTVVGGVHSTRLVPPSSAELRDVVDQLEQTVAIEPNNAQAHQMLGDCYYFIGDTVRERSEYATATELRGGLSVIDSAKRKSVLASREPLGNSARP